MPLKRHNAGQWADQAAQLVLAAVSTSRSMFQHRNELGHVKLIQKVFPEHEDLACSHDQPNTILIPCICGDLHKDWVYQDKKEVLRSRCLLSFALATLAVDMVQAELRRTAK